MPAPSQGRQGRREGKREPWFVYSVENFAEKPCEVSNEVRMESQLWFGITMFLLGYCKKWLEAGKEFVRVLEQHN